MSRLKHLFSLILKFMIILIAFIVPVLYSALVDYRTNDIMVTGNIDISDIVFTVKSGEANYDVIDNSIIVNITSPATKYDDISLILFTPNIIYDSTYLNEILGTGYEDYIGAMENGPWLCTLDYNISTGSGKNISYTVYDSDDNEYIFSSVSKLSKEYESTNKLEVSKNEKLQSAILFGTKNNILEADTYTISVKVKITGLTNNSFKLPVTKSLSVFFKVLNNALSSYGFENIFRIENFLMTYGILCLVGTFMYLYRDSRNAVKIFKAVFLNSEPGVVIYNVYVNGSYYGQISESGAPTAVVKALLIVVIYEFVAIITLPIRMILQIVKDIIGLVKNDENMSNYSLTGNIIGSIGVYLLLFALVGIIGAGYMIGIISLVISIIMLIIAKILCRKAENA